MCSWTKSFFNHASSWLTSFPLHDVDKIWSKHNEVANQLQEDLKRSKTGTLEQLLRQVKDRSRKRKRSAL